MHINFYSKALLLCILYYAFGILYIWKYIANLFNRQTVLMITAANRDDVSEIPPEMSCSRKYGIVKCMCDILKPDL